MDGRTVQTDWSGRLSFTVFCPPLPVFTVASESAFNTRDRVLDSFRSSLSPLTIEALICCQNWLRSTSSLVKFREAMDEVQSIDEELESGNLFILYLYVQFSMSLFFTCLFIY